MFPKINPPGEACCCDLANTPHIHTSFKGNDSADKINSKFSVTFFLKEGWLLPVPWKVGEKYNENELVILGTGPLSIIWQCMRGTSSIPGTCDNWVQWAIMSSWRGHWSKYYEYSAGDICYINDGFYKCQTGSPIGVYPKDSIYNNAGIITGRWVFLNAVGQRFPAWMQNYGTTFTIDLDMRNALCIHPTTGGQFWELPQESYIGSEVSSINNHHHTIQKIFRDCGETEATKIFTVKILHCGTCKPTPEEDDPRPDEQKFFGMTMGVYIIPPKNMTHVAEGDTASSESSSEGTGECTGEGNCAVSAHPVGTGVGSGETDDSNQDMSSLLPMVSPQTGLPYSDIYFQWEAEYMPFIAQPLEDDTTITNSILCLLNREPHEQYTNLFRNSASALHHCNRIITSSDVFKREYMNDCIRAGVSIPQGNISAEYQKWKIMKNNEKNTTMQSSYKLWIKATQDWKDWLWKLRQYSENIQGRINYIAQDYYGVEKWINSDGKKCPIDKVKWTDKSGTVITVSDIILELEAIEHIWDIMECSVSGLDQFYIHEIQKRIEIVDGKLACYKMNDKINKSNKNRNKKSRKGK
jgi:hypothetical protein